MAVILKDLKNVTIELSFSGIAAKATAVYKWRGVWAGVRCLSVSPYLIPELK